MTRIICSLLTVINEFIIVYVTVTKLVIKFENGAMDS